MSTEKPISLRPRGQVAPIAAIVFVVAVTFASAAVQIIPSRLGSPAQQCRDERAAIVEQRRTRIAELRTSGDRCHPASAHELARLLVMDGQWSTARNYADDYELRCGEDPVVRNWGNAPRPRIRH